MYIMFKENVLDPIGKSRLLIIDKETPVLNAGRKLSLLSLECPNTFRPFDWNIRKPPPRRDANLLTNIVNAIDGTSHVASCNDESSIDTWERIVDDLSDI